MQEKFIKKIISLKSTKSIIYEKSLKYFLKINDYLFLFF